MATLAPYSANRTAIAWPMPELPPVTRTFLPASPGRCAARGAVTVWDIDTSWLRCGPKEQQPGEREQQDREQAGADEGGAARRVDQLELHPDRGRGDDE